MPLSFCIAQKKIFADLTEVGNAEAFHVFIGVGSRVTGYFVGDFFPSSRAKTGSSGFIPIRCGGLFG
jgi:hypothetical protein